MDCDYYRALGLDGSASQADIRHAYRRLAMRWHPDRNLETADQAEQIFKSVQQAYTVLKDPVTRAAYDAQLAQTDRATRNHANTSRARPKAAQRPGTRGADYMCETTIPLETAVLGGAALTRVNVRVACARCAGVGQLKSLCEICQGRGTLARRFVGKQVHCDPCEATGWQSYRCEACSGAGYSHVAKLLRVKIPPRILDGTVLRAKGLGGESIDGGPRGHLLCKVTVRADRVFTVHGLDLQRELKIDFVVACLGGRISVMRFRKPVMVEVPPMTYSGALIRIAGQGLHDASRRRTGDLVLKIVIDLPPKMRPPNEQQRAVLRALVRSYRAASGSTDGREREQ